MSAKKGNVLLDVDIECDLEPGMLNDVNWFVFTGETPRRDKGNRRVSRAKSWRILDICTWLGRKVR